MERAVLEGVLRSEIQRIPALIKDHLTDAIIKAKKETDRLYGEREAGTDESEHGGSPSVSGVEQADPEPEVFDQELDSTHARIGFRPQGRTG